MCVGMPGVRLCGLLLAHSDALFADKAPAVKSPTMRGLKQVDEEAPKEGEPWQDQGWPEEEEVPPREIFPEDDEDDSLREEGLRDELEHEGDDTGAVDDFDLPQEAEGETGAAAADEGIIEVYYHWESLPSDGAILVHRARGSLSQTWRLARHTHKWWHSLL